MNLISAKVIADSITPRGGRCTTFILKFPRIVLAEFNTHRAISKNSASSRAIPFKRMVELAQTEPFIPMKFMKEHKGMQGTEYFDEYISYDMEAQWKGARDAAVFNATTLSNMGLSKQICNRLLEPFMYHTVICTGTEWGNFFALRAHDQAEIHIQDLAYKMLKAYNESQPKSLSHSDWHIPFGDQFDSKRIMDLGANSFTEIQEIKVKIASARCARVSYLNFEGKDDYEADLKLHDSLITSGHMSPFEHCAQYNKYVPLENLTGNLKGYVQYRKQFMGENRKDSRVISKL